VGIGKEEPVPARPQVDADPDVDVATASTVVVAFEPRLTRADDLALAAAGAPGAGSAGAAGSGAVGGLVSPTARGRHGEGRRGSGVGGVGGGVGGVGGGAGEGEGGTTTEHRMVITNQTNAISHLNATWRSAANVGRNPLYGSNHFCAVAHPPGNLVEHEDRMDRARAQDRFNTLYRMIGNTNLQVGTRSGAQRGVGGGVGEGVGCVGVSAHDTVWRSLPFNLVPVCSYCAGPASTCA